MKRFFFFLLPFLILGLAVFIRILEPLFVDEIRQKVFDQYQRHRPRAYQEAPVRIVDVDEESLKRLGQWPWPRTLLADLVDRISGDGASVIAFDVIFAETDRTSPENVAPIWAARPALKPFLDALEDIPSHDEILAASMRKARVVTGFAPVAQTKRTEPVLKSSMNYVGAEPLEYLPPFYGAVINIPAIEAAASGSGALSTIPENDGVIRRVPALFRLFDKLYPSLAAEAVRLYLGESGFLIRYSGDAGEEALGRRHGLETVQIGKLSLPVDSQGRLWLYDTGHIPGRYVPAWKVLEKKAGDALKGSIVLIGTSAQGLKDLRASPVQPAGAGVEIHAQMIEQMLLGKFLIRPDWALFAELGYLVVLSTLLIFLVPGVGALGGALLGVSFMTGAFIFSWYGFVSRQWLIDPVFPSAAAGVIYFFVFFVHFFNTERERRRIRNAFSRYMSPHLVTQLSRSPHLLKLGGEMKVITLLFCDIRGFSSFAEKMSAQELTSFMNRFLTPMTEIILKHDGTIDKYIGDCIMAFWNAPLDDPEHARHACQAVLAMQQNLRGWNKKILRGEAAEKGISGPVHVGFGINTGECSVGNFGSNQRFDYSVLGDNVNLASRLESQSKIYGVDIMTGQHTYEILREDFFFLEVDLVRVKGRAAPERIFGLFGDAAYRESDNFRKLAGEHQAMLSAYRMRQWDKAKKQITVCLSLDTPETRLRKLYALYRERIEHFEANPPGKDWDAVA